MKAKKSYHHGDLRKALVDAAAILAAASGPEAVSLREVAKKAGVSHAAPYHHFKNRAELLHGVALEGFRLMFEEMEVAAAKSYTSPVDRLNATGLAYIRFAVGHPHYFRAMFRGVCLDETLPDEDQHGRQNFDRLVKGVQACLGETGTLSRRAEQLILVAWTIVHGMASLGVERGFKGTPFEGRDVEELARMAAEAARPLFEAAVGERGGRVKKTRHRAGAKRKKAR